jgi:hypothetical protein
MFDISTMLFLHTYAGDDEHGAPKPEAPSPVGGEGERAGDDGEPPPTEKDLPAPAEPATPDANPIDPRVFTRR